MSMINSMKFVLVQHIKYLEINIEKKLKFDMHFDYLMWENDEVPHKKTEPKVGQTNKLQKVQNRCMELIWKAKWGIHKKSC